VHPRRILDLEQPFTGDPDHLLGKCARCPHWYVVSYDPWESEYRVAGRVELTPVAQVA